MKILLADDDTRIHVIMNLWLTRNGHQVDNAHNGREALEKIQAGSYDGLITDMNMPLLKGVELINAVNQMPVRPAWMVLLTSRCDLPEIKKQINCPEVHIFNKPFSPAKLTEIISSFEVKA